MSDKEFTLFAIFAAIAGFVWWIYEKHKQAAATAVPGTIGGTLPENLNWPMDSVNPQTYSPPSIGKVSMSVNNPGFNLLSNQYIPLFGFVGMSTGSYYQ